MKITTDTQQFLKNFALTNPKLYVKRGSVLATTTSPVDSVLIRAEIEEEFPMDFCLYDLNNFNLVFSLLDSPDVEFLEHYAVFRSDDNRQKLRYYYSSPTTVKAPGADMITMPESVVEFDLTQETWNKLQKAHAIITKISSSPELVYKNGELVVVDRTNTTSNLFAVRVGEEDGIEFAYNYENLKFLAGDYRVCSAQKVSHFKHQTKNIQYWITHLNEE